MEESGVQEPQEVKLVVTEEMRSYLYDATKWARFMSVVGFVFSAFLIIGSFGIGAAMQAQPELTKQLGPVAGLGSIGITAFYIVLALVFFYPSLMLMRFANKGRQGILFGDQEELNDSMSNVKSLFKFFGILTIVTIVSYFLLFMLMAASVAGI